MKIFMGCKVITINMYTRSIVTSYNGERLISHYFVHRENIIQVGIC